MTEDKMVGWHHRLDGHEFEQAPGSLACCSCKEWDITEQLNNTEMKMRGLLWWSSGLESTCQFREHRFNPWSGKIPHVLG